MTTAEIAEGVDAVSSADIKRLAGRLLAPGRAAPAALGPARALGAPERFERVLFG